MSGIAQRPRQPMPEEVEEALRTGGAYLGMPHAPSHGGAS